jgi:hypothetical protein
MVKSNRGSNGKEKINMSQAIRDMMDEHPRAKSKEIMSLLADKGIRVQPSLVYFIRGQRRHRKGKQRRARFAETSRQIGSINPVEMVVKLKGLAESVGGLKNLKRLVDALAE